MIRGLLALVLLTSVSNIQVCSQERLESPISASASKTNVLIAESFTVRVEVVTSPGNQVEFPEVLGGDESRLGVFDVRATQTFNDIPLDGPGPKLRLWTQTLTLETLRLGEHSIPSLSAILIEDGTSRTLATKPIEITVRGVLENEDESLREISGEIELKPITSSNRRGLPTWSIVTVLVAAAALISVIGFRGLRKRQHPLVWCRRELKQLDEELHTVGEEFYPCDHLNWTKRLRSVLRTAVSSQREGESRFPSTQQLVAEMAAIDETGSMGSCEQVLQELDRVRFSNESSDLRSECSFAVACEAIREAGSLLDQLQGLSRSNSSARSSQRGV